MKSRSHTVHFRQCFYFSRHNIPRPSLIFQITFQYFPPQVGASVKVSFFLPLMRSISLVSFVTEICLVGIADLRLTSCSFSCSLRVLYAVNEFNGFFLKTTFKDAKQKWVSKSIFLLIIRAILSVNVVDLSLFSFIQCTSLVWN